jgi:hypothetical protein
MFDFPAGSAPGVIFEPNGPGTEPSYTFTGVGWTYGSTTELLISSVIPNNAICGSPLINVRALGANFTATTEVLFDGVPAANKAFVSVSEMTFDINPVPETVPRTAVITVRDGATVGVGAVPFGFRVVTTVEYRIGIDETSPGIVDVLPANTIGELGGVKLDPRSATQGLEYDIATALVTAPLATPLLAGVLTEPPDDSKGYVRQTTGAASTWVPPADTPTPDYGIGLTEDTTATPTVVNLDIANTNGEIGGVMTEPRTDIQGLDMAATGLITVPLATPLLAGSIVEPPADAKGYVRTTQTTGVSQWVPPAAAELPDFGIGLSLDTSTDPDIVHLQPAGDSPATLGGVYVVDRVRNNTEGLELGIDGRLRVPPATDSLLGGILEPPNEDRGWVRTYKGGVGAWVPPADPAPPPLAITLVIPNTVPVGSAPQIIEVHGTKFTAATTVNFGTATPAVTFVSETELTFEIDPTLETVRTLSVTINDSGLPGQGDAPFYFRASDKLYQGTWQPVTNTPDILTPPKGDKWMWIADTVDPRGSELVPTTIPGIGGRTIREGDHVVWDAAANAFFMIETRVLTVVDIIPSQMLIGAPPLDVQVYGSGFTATTQVLWEGVAIPTTFIAQDKLRIRVDQATMLPPARGFVVVNVVDGTVAAEAGTGFQFLEKIDVQPAGDTELEIGVVYVPGRTNMQALTLGAQGMLTCYLATPQLAGAILEPPSDDKGYVRQTSSKGGSSWVPPALPPEMNWGIGLEQRGTQNWVDLTAANIAGQIGGVKSVGRGPTNGIDIAVDGTISAPLATAVAAGTIVEPPEDGKPYSRQRDTAGVSTWVPGAAAISFSASQPFNPVPTDPELAVGPPQHLVTIPAASLPTVACNWLIDIGYMHNRGNGAQATTGNGGIWKVAIEDPVGSGNWVDLFSIGYRTDSYPDANDRLLRGTNLIATSGDADRIWRWDPATMTQIQLGVRMADGTSPTTPWNIFIGIDARLVP